MSVTIMCGSVGMHTSCSGVVHTVVDDHHIGAAVRIDLAGCRSVGHIGLVVHTGRPAGSFAVVRTDLAVHSLIDRSSAAIGSLAEVVHSHLGCAGCTLSRRLAAEAGIHLDCSSGRSLGCCSRMGLT